MEQLATIHCHFSAADFVTLLKTNHEPRVKYKKTDSTLFSNIRDVGFHNGYLMHDDVNDGGRNLEYAAGGVIWPTPLLLYSLNSSTFNTELVRHISR